MWEVHSIGAVWAEVLFVVTEKLIKAHGWEIDLFPPTPLHPESSAEEYAAHASFYNTSMGAFTALGPSSANEKQSRARSTQPRAIHSPCSSSLTA
jgi:hypothetical protein